MRADADPLELFGRHLVNQAQRTNVPELAERHRRKLTVLHQRGSTVVATWELPAALRAELPQDHRWWLVSRDGVTEVASPRAARSETS